MRSLARKPFKGKARRADAESRRDGEMGTRRRGDAGTGKNHLTLVIGHLRFVIEVGRAVYRRSKRRQIEPATSTMNVASSMDLLFKLWLANRTWDKPPFPTSMTNLKCPMTNVKWFFPVPASPLPRVTRSLLDCHHSHVPIQEHLIPHRFFPACSCRAEIRCRICAQLPGTSGTLQRPERKGS